jgi:bacillithiol biosynthesis cysteine-adding enzyme BshC
MVFTVRFTTTPVPYAAVPFLGPDHVLTRLAAGEHATFPLLARTPEAATGDRRVIVTGQQPCLLTGPLYTVLKAASVCRLARDCAAAGNHEVRPLFWIASEDHDVLEVNRVTINGRSLVCPYGGSLKRGEVPPVGAISLEEERSRILDFLDEALPATEFKPGLLEQVAGCRFESYGTQFGDLVAGLFRPWGLETVEPAALRETTSPVLARLVAAWPETEAAFRRGCERLRERGYEPPLASLRFYELDEGRRVPVEVDGERVRLSSGSVSFAEAAAAIRERPRHFSPGAALRPVLQDAALSVGATVAGPTEILYLWQLRELYAVAGVTPAPLVPRLSATFLEKKVEKKLKQLGIPPGEAFTVPDLLASAVREAAETPDPAADAVEAAAAGLAGALEAARTPANRRWLDRSLRSVKGTVEKAVARLRKEASESRSLRGDQLRAVAEAILPGGKPQDRVVNVLDLLVRYGSDWVRAVVEDTDPWGLYHHVVMF